MKKSIFAAALVAACFATAAGATPGNNGGGNGGCGVGQQTNGCGGTTGGNGGTGGTGGAGGAGGTGIGVGIGIAGASAASAATATGGNASASGGNAAVVGSGNSTNNIRNTNNNANVQGQQQGQQQGQTQSSRNNNANSNRNNNQSSATGGAGGQSSATGGASGGNTMSTGVTVEGDKGDAVYAPAQERAPVATAYAAPLVSSNGTCMGSTSGGVQLAGWGATGATTWTDNNCDIRYDAEALRAAGLPLAARARLCQKDEIAKAMAAAGTPCEDKGAARRVSAILDGAPVVAEAAPQPQYQDPIVRARLGLPPLK